jgi:hypothetical protein
VAAIAWAAAWLGVSRIRLADLKAAAGDSGRAAAGGGARKKGGDIFCASSRINISLARLVATVAKLYRASAIFNISDKPVIKS